MQWLDTHMHIHAGEKKQGSKHVPYAQLEALSAKWVYALQFSLAIKICNYWAFSQFFKVKNWLNKDLFQNKGSCSYFFCCCSCWRHLVNIFSVSMFLVVCKLECMVVWQYGRRVCVCMCVCVCRQLDIIVLKLFLSEKIQHCWWREKSESPTITHLCLGSRPNKYVSLTHLRTRGSMDGGIHFI